MNTLKRSAMAGVLVLLWAERRSLWCESVATSAATPAQAASAISPSSVSQTLVRLAAKGDRSAVEQLLREGVRPDARNKDGFTALIWAAGQGHIDVVQLLLAKGADVN